MRFRTMVALLSFEYQFFSLMTSFAGELPPLPEPLSLEPTPAACQCLECDCVDCRCDEQIEPQLVSVATRKQDLPLETTAAGRAEPAHTPSSARPLAERLGYGHPDTLAPLVMVADRPRLTNAEADRAIRLFNRLGKLEAIDRHHRPDTATRAAAPVRLPPPEVPVAPPSGYIRVYAGTSCANGVCTPQYHWVPAQAAGAGMAPEVRRFQPLRRRMLPRRR